MKNSKENINKKAITWLTLAHMANDTYSGFLNPIMPFIAAKLGFTMAIATVIMSIAQICASMIQPIFGFFADNMNKRLFIFWGLIFGSLFVPLATNAPNIPLLIFFIILGNFGGSFFHPQALGFISKFSDNNFVSNMGIFISAGTIGFSFGPIISAVVAEHLGFDKIPYLSIVGLIIAAAMFKCVPKISKSDNLLKKKEFKASFKEVLSNKFMIILIVIAMMKSLILNSCSILLPFLWKDLGHSPTYIGFALFLFLLMGGIGSFLSGRIENKIGAKNVFYISMIGTLPIMALFIATYRLHPFISIGIFIFMGFITMLAQPVILVMAQRILPEYKSITSGFINGFTWGLVAVLLTIVGFFAQKFGIGKIMLIVAAIPAFTSFLVKFLPDHVEIKK